MWVSIMIFGGWVLQGLAVNLWAYLSDSGTGQSHDNDWMLYLE